MRFSEQETPPTFILVLARVGELWTASLDSSCTQGSTHAHTHSRTHTHSNVPIGRVGFTQEQLINNITSAMKGVASHIPQGLRNIQSIHLKTPDSIALPIYNSLPPPPGLLPASTDQPPAVKRLKLDTDLNNPSNSESEEEVDLDRRRKGPISERSVEPDASGEDGVRKSGKRGSVSKGKRAKLSKFSVKKVRGSTVRSSKYEKALRRRAMT